MGSVGTISLLQLFLFQVMLLQKYLDVRENVLENSDSGRHRDHLSDPVEMFNSGFFFLFLF